MTDAKMMISAIEAYCQAETECDKPRFMALFADDVVHEDPVGYNAVRRGKEGIEELWDMAQAGNVELWLEEKVIVCGNEAIAIMRSRTGPDDARRELGPIVDHFTFDESGKICSVRAFYNLPTP